MALDVTRATQSASIERRLRRMLGDERLTPPGCYQAEVAQVLDWPALLRASKKAGVKYYFIEDESPTVLEQIPQSLKYLEQVKF